MFWKQAIRAWSSGWIEVPNELIAAIRWLRVYALFCGCLEPAQETGDGRGFDAVEGELILEGLIFVAEIVDQDSERVATVRDHPLQHRQTPKTSVTQRRPKAPAELLDTAPSTMDKAVTPSSTAVLASLYAATDPVPGSGVPDRPPD